MVIEWGSKERRGGTQGGMQVGTQVKPFVTESTDTQGDTQGDTQVEPDKRRSSNKTMFTGETLHTYGSCCNHFYYHNIIYYFYNHSQILKLIERVKTLIKSIHIDNFMSIKSADIEFDNRNIIDLCGYNDSGKSAIIRLIDIMFYNAYPTEQVHFIQNGEDFFRCVMVFTDGVEYERIKRSTGASIFILRKDGKEIYTNQSGRQIISTNGIPKVIADYLGVVKDEYTGEELNVRRCTDRLFLITTTGGDNYKILNTILQSDALAATSTQLNTDKNKLQQEVVARYNQLSALENQRKETPVVPTDRLDELENSVATLEEMTDRCNAICKAKDEKAVFDSIIVYPEVSKVNIQKYESIVEIMGYKNTASAPLPAKISMVDSDKLAELQMLATLKDTASMPLPVKVSNLAIDKYTDLRSLMIAVTAAKEVTVPRGIDATIDIDRYCDIKALHDSYATFSTANNDYIAKQSKYDTVHAKLKELAEQYNLAICSNCGAISVGGHIHE